MLHSPLQEGNGTFSWPSVVLLTLATKQLRRSPTLSSPQQEGAQNRGAAKLIVSVGHNHPSLCPHSVPPFHFSPSHCLSDAHFAFPVVCILHISVWNASQSNHICEVVFLAQRPLISMINDSANHLENANEGAANSIWVGEPKQYPKSKSHLNWTLKNGQGCIEDRNEGRESQGGQFEQTQGKNISRSIQETDGNLIMPKCRVVVGWGNSI